MKINIPEYFQSCPLKNVTKNPPDKRIIFWGKIEDYNQDKNEITMSEKEWAGKIKLGKVNQQQVEILVNNKDKIGKIYGIVKMEGIEMKHFIQWDVKEELIDKLNSLIFD
ncbi:MAG: hypothetical protein ACW981_13625 [Candidatus Hodarchaeales archaeon]|jgi:hypothetical protein